MFVRCSISEKLPKEGVCDRLDNIGRGACPWTHYLFLKLNVANILFFCHVGSFGHQNPRLYRTTGENDLILNVESS